MSELEQREFEIEGTHFIMEKMPAMQAFDLFENIRHELDSVVDTADLKQALSGIDANEADGNFFASVIKLVLRLRPEFLATVRHQLFEYVRYQTPDSPGSRVLQNEEFKAFTEPLDIHEILVRALAVNFGGSIRRIVSRWKTSLV